MTKAVVITSQRTGNAARPACPEAPPEPAEGLRRWAARALLEVAVLGLLALLGACAGAPEERMPPAAPPIATASALSPTSTPVVISPAPSATPPAPAPPAPALEASAPREVVRGSLERREIALTFDCGGHAGPTRAILHALREADVRVTFFMIGDWVRAYPELAREIAERHEIAHHSLAHPDYVMLSDAAIIEDLERGERAILEVTGRTTQPLWRAPSGSRDARVLAAAARAGWPLHVFWTLERDAGGALVSGDSGDWRGLSAEQVAANVEVAAGLGTA